VTYIKSIVTAEAKMDVERKGIQSYQSDIYARFLCFGNGALTALYDHSDFWRRQLVLTTKDRPANREDDPFLVEALSAELEGILLWCLEGLQRLLRNSYKFTVSPKASANLETIKRSSNNVLDFLDSEGYFRYKADFSISSRDLYEIYKLWCEDNACHPVSAARLSSEVSQNAIRLNLEPTNNIYLPGGRRVRGFVGIEALVYPAA
jgi:putative DNA primase/helicase